MNQFALNSSLLKERTPNSLKAFKLIYDLMRDRMERLVVLPFTMGCVSQSSIEVGTKKSKPAPNPVVVSRRHEGEEERSSGVGVKRSWRFFSFGMHKLIIKSFKSMSQLFVYKEDDEEMDREIEIGFPTDVKHVTHIGWDGSSTTNPVKGWESLQTPQLLSFPSISLRQFEQAMTAQVEHAPAIGAATNAQHTLS